MSAAIQLVPSQFSKREKAIEELDSVAAGSAEQRLRQAIDYINEMQAEIRALHSELARSERAIAQKDQLLKNATMREQMLRAELVKGAF